MCRVGKKFELGGGVVEGVDFRICGLIINSLFRGM